MGHGASLSENVQVGMHNMWMCGQMRLLAMCLVLSRVPTGMACRYFPSHHRTWLEHYDSNTPLLGHLIDAGAMGRQTTNGR